MRHVGSMAVDQKAKVVSSTGQKLPKPPKHIIPEVLENSSVGFENTQSKVGRYYNSANKTPDVNNLRSVDTAFRGS